MSEIRTLSVLVENKPGVLMRVASLFARRAFNIRSLAVGETEHAEISRITVVVDAEDHPIEQITKQLNKLVNVLKVVDISAGPSVIRQLVLFKVNADDEHRTAVLQIVELFRAHVVDVTPTSVIIEAVGDNEKVNALLTALSPYGVREIVQSGALAIARGPRSITDQLKEKDRG
ncbi:acetolactate synthase small subunit [Gleimia europaea]|uniref:Acetolactate synthase small subunit n=1 Tax=Gleimia europaea ACS-120-V-Col10b TaxID=883069 RepID=A0A9W5VVQ6_9ACTO|nr:acetolactate synthase small subunit [Gleimia europaea]EPD29416.1 acetolactate synthase, small subunit [Gleimia europaea ACS-120-V-Col10b]